MAPFYGWGSTPSRLEPLRGGLYYSVKKKKSGKAAGPTEVNNELLTICSYMCMNIVADIIISIIRDRKVPKDWKQSHIINL